MKTLFKIEVNGGELVGYENLQEAYFNTMSDHGNAEYPVYTLSDVTEDMAKGWGFKYQVHKTAKKHLEEQIIHEMWEVINQYDDLSNILLVLIPKN